MIEAKANGMVFTFPNETSQEVMLEMIDAYFGKEALKHKSNEPLGVSLITLLLCLTSVFKRKRHC